jgi:tetratricopeptide (TPR) repeat protein
MSDIKEKIATLGIAIDSASDKKDETELRKAISLLNEFNESTENELDKATKYYFKANAWSALRQINIENNPDKTWLWESEELEEEIFNLRQSSNAILKLEGDKSDLRFRVSTNLANTLNHIGRFAEAIELWSNVLVKYPNFSMAHGNKGYGFNWYSRALYDDGHKIIFLWKAREHLQKALELKPEDHAIIGLTKTLQEINKVTDWSKFNYSFRKESLGRSRKEKAYRGWLLNNRLFLNPLNDIGELEISSNDILTFPSVLLPIDECGAEPPIYYGIYNQLKQDFVSARYILFEGLKESEENKTHFSDKKVKLYNTLDYRTYRLWVEKVKMSYLSAYAIFDKIAYLVNIYFKLGVSEKRVNFRTLWYEQCNPKKGLRKLFQKSNNWPLRGLFWLSKDLFYTEKSKFMQSLEPDAQELNVIRQHIAHKYLTVHDEILGIADNHRTLNPELLSYPVRADELKRKSLILFKLVRNALIYVSLGAHWHETYNKESPSNGLIGSLLLTELSDNERL